MSGEIPGGWASARMADVVRIVTDGVTAEDLAKMPEVYHYSLPAFDASGQPDIGPGASIKSNKTIVPSDCVLFSKLNPRIPRIWRVRQSASAHSYCSTEFWPLVRKADKIDLDFLAHIVGSERFLSDPAIAPSSSTNSHQRVDRKSFEGFRLLLPPLDEQRRIAEVLRSMDEVIAAEEKVAFQLNTILTHGRSILVESTGDGWPRCRIGEVARTFAGGTPKRDRPDYFGGNIPWLKSGEVRAKRIRETDEQITEVALKETAARLVRAGTPVIAMYGATAGVVGMLEIDAAINQAVLAVDPNRDLLEPRYCVHALEASGDRLLRTLQGSGQPNLSKSLIDAFEINVPDLATQRALAVSLDSLESQLADLKTTEAALKRVRASLSADLLSGRVRVPA
jgi:restriction endonuclease S subunit